MKKTKRSAASSATLTFLFADLRDYTTFVEEQGDVAATELIRDFRRLVRGQLALLGGGEIKTEGDSFYLVFTTAGRAIECAVAILNEAAGSTSAHPARPMKVGIGIHAGEPVALERQFVGSAVNLAARLGSAAGAGELLISETVRGLLRTSGLPPVAERPEVVLKGIVDPPRVYEVAWRGTAYVSAGAGEEPSVVPLFSRRRVVLGARTLAVAGAAAALIAAALILSQRTGPTLVLVAGLGTNGYSGDGGPALVAQLSELVSMFFDGDGRLLVTDSQGGISPTGQFIDRTRLRRIAGDGTVTTLSGDGTLDFATSASAAALAMDGGGHAALGPAGALFVAFSGESIFTGVSGIGNLGRIDTDGTFHLLFAGRIPGNSAGGGSAQLWGLVGPQGLTVDHSGTIFLIDRTSVVRAISPTGTISIVAGTGERGNTGDGGPATAATLFAPTALALSADEQLFIADTNNNRVRRIDHGGTILPVIDGLASPSSLAFGPGGVLYVADTGNARVLRITPDGKVTTVAGPSGLLRPTALAVDASGVLFIGDSGLHRIFRLATR